MVWRHIKEVTWFEDAKDKTFSIEIRYDGDPECRKWLLQWCPALCTLCQGVLKQKEGEAKDERKE